MKNTINIKNIAISLIQSIDLVNYLLKDHHRRVAIIAYEIGRKMEISPKKMKKLLLAASLHDVGALYVKERDDLIDIDTKSPIEHAVRGSFLLKQFDYFENISNIVLHHHRYWGDGRGQMFADEEVPIEAFILHLSDRIEILLDQTKHYTLQVEEIVKIIQSHTPEMFNPICVQAFLNLSEQDSFWLNIEKGNLEHLLHSVIEDEELNVSFIMLEKLSNIFSNIVDYKSHFTASHSYAVGQVAYELALKAGLSEVTSQKLKLSGYLHDIGKIGIPTELIEKEAELTSHERNILKSHAYYTNLILSGIEGIEDICHWASMHHEKRDGSGYPFHIGEKEITKEIEILSLADIFTALSENRPYRTPMNHMELIGVLELNFKSLFTKEIFNLVIDNIDYFNMIRDRAQDKALKSYASMVKKVNATIASDGIVI